MGRYHEFRRELSLNKFNFKMILFFSIILVMLIQSRFCCYPGYYAPLGHPEFFKKSERHARGAVPIAAFDSYLPTGNLCYRKLPITNWIRVYDRYRDENNNIKDNVNFVNGVYTTPARGIYHCCASARCKDKGVCDFTIRRNGVAYGAFGTRTTLFSEFSTVGLCVTSLCEAGVKWKVNFESGGRNDCMEETGWRYNKFSCFLASDS